MWQAQQQAVALPPSPSNGRTVVMTKKLLHNESAPMRWLRDRYRRHLHGMQQCAHSQRSYEGVPCRQLLGKGGAPTPSEGGALLGGGGGGHPRQVNPSVSARLRDSDDKGAVAHARGMTIRLSSSHLPCIPFPSIHQRTWLDSPRVSRTPQTAS